MVFPNLIEKNFCKTPITLELDKEGISKYGEPLEPIKLELLCNYQDNAKTVLTAEKKLIQLSGTAYFNGDIASDFSTLSGGLATVYGVKRRICRGFKARNPDGTVNYTRIDLE